MAVDFLVEEIKKVQDRLNKKIELFFGDYKKPYSLITQSSKGVEIEIKMPGMRKKNVIIDMNEKMIEIRAEKSRRILRGFHRKISLPSGLAIEKAKSVLTRGGLKIFIPKSK